MLPALSKHSASTLFLITKFSTSSFPYISSVATQFCEVKDANKFSSQGNDPAHHEYSLG
jgi:hypothetical protein